MRRISTRLAVSFLIVALLPTLPLSLVVRNLLDRRFGPAISEPLERALDAGLDESRDHLRQLQNQMMDQVDALEQTTPQLPLILLDLEGRVQPADSLSFLLATSNEPFEEAVKLNQAGDGISRKVLRLGNNLVLGTGPGKGQGTVWIQPLPPGLVERAQDLTEGVSLVRTLRSERGRVLGSFVGPFLLVYAVLILVALLLGFLWSRQIVGPLEMLVTATRKVSSGDLEFRLPREGTGEVGELVHSFDNMVGRLADQRRDLARLERAAAWRGMARTLAHEVKNPLTPILLAVNQVRDKYTGDDAEYRDLLGEVAEIVGEEVESLRNLVKEFGDFARLPKPRPSQGDMRPLLNDLQQLYGQESLQLDLGSGAMEGWFDAEAVRRALVNLIDNGLAACLQAGQPALVSIMATPLEPGVRLEIQDRGVGIPEANLARVFEPDFTTKSDGMGLGLAIVESIVMGHGGRISVTSQQEAGTTFRVDLPLTRPADAESIEEDESL